MLIKFIDVGVIEISLFKYLVLGFEGFCCGIKGRLLFGMEVKILENSYVLV